VIFGPWQLARKITRERAVARRSRCWGNNILQGIHQQVINHNQSINQSINQSMTVTLMKQFALQRVKVSLTRKPSYRRENRVMPLYVNFDTYRILQ